MSASEHGCEFLSQPEIGSDVRGVSSGPGYRTEWHGIYRGIRESEWAKGEMVHFFENGSIGDVPQSCFAMPVERFAPAEDQANEIDLDALAAAVRDLGFHAYVEQTGGGCATLFAGEEHPDAHGDKRWDAGAGPGWFDGPGWTNARASIGQGGDFCVGPDDDGDDPESVSWIQPGASLADIAALIAAQVRRSATSRAS